MRERTQAESEGVFFRCASGVEGRERESEKRVSFFSCFLFYKMAAARAHTTGRKEGNLNLPAFVFSDTVNNVLFFC